MCFIKYIGITLGLIYAFITLDNNIARHWNRKYNTIAHEFLDMEKEFGVGTLEYKTLDEIIDEAKDKIEVKLNYSRKEAIDILKTISNILIEKGYKYQEKTHLLSRSLKTKEIDCDGYSFIYLAITEQMNLPLSAVGVPHHVFVRWHLDKGYINWETIYSTHLDDEQYKSQYKVSEEAVRNGVFMKSLTKKETLALQHINLGSAWKRLNNIDKAIYCYNKSAKLNPKDSDVYFLRASAWRAKGNLEKARQDSVKAFELNPYNK